MPQRPVRRRRVLRLQVRAGALPRPQAAARDVHAGGVVRPMRPRQPCGRQPPVRGVQPRRF